MKRIEAPSGVDLNAVLRAYRRGADRWTGCDWSTQFGGARLDLNGMSSLQALLMARATAGVEADLWRNVVQWLSEVELDARTAQDAARSALLQVRLGNFEKALHHARRACLLESKYHTLLIWQPLLDALQLVE